MDNPNSVRRRLSQTLGQLKKGYAADTFEGGFPTCQTIMGVSGISANVIMAATALTAAAQSVVTGLQDPDCFRTVSVTTVGAAAAGSVTVRGHDWADREIRETIVIAGAGTQLGAIPFKDVFKVDLPAITAPGETVSVGVTNRLGIYRPWKGFVASSFVVLERKASAATEFSVEGTDPALNLTYGTFIPDGGITADDSFKIQYHSDVF